ncbi:MAG: cation-translocating P-type ATPase [Gammaproteobacteria bacterium]|nr:cation-translocating P-type ATPase [Gammaproteobacteria bacterium]
MRRRERDATLARFEQPLEDGLVEAHLILERIECPACALMIERRLGELDGVRQALVNVSTNRLVVRYARSPGATLDLSRILEFIESMGYGAQPYDPARQELSLQREQRAQLRRLLIAGFLCAQIMMLSSALYYGDWWGMEPQFRELFSWSALVLCIPVLGYCASSFYAGAWRGLRYRQPGMDLPVALGLSIAFAGSVHALLGGGGSLYFESVAMFVFFLLLARYLEFLARKRSAMGVEALLQERPTMALRIDPHSGAAEVVAASSLQPGERVRVLPGEGIPADGRILTGQSSVDRSLLTGESMPLPVKAGDEVLAGTVNHESTLELEVVRGCDDSVLAQIHSLVERARQHRPPIAALADRLAGWFVLAVLLLAALVAALWYVHQPERWLAVTVAMLVVTCPCALSLATPAAIAAVTGRLAGLGLVPIRGRTIEALAEVDHFVLDKTGTLTRGEAELVSISTFVDGALDRLETLELRPGTTRNSYLADQLQDEYEAGSDAGGTTDTDATQVRSVHSDSDLALAAALEQHSEHPLARAILKEAGERFEERLGQLQASDVQVEPGAGVQGTIDGSRLFVGSLDFVQRALADRPGLADLRSVLREVLDNPDGDSLVLLADENSVRSVFRLRDELRDDALSFVTRLQRMGIQPLIFSGDNLSAVSSVARRLDGVDFLAELTPADKHARLQALAAAGHRVGMLGDGVNDAPVLAAASVSVAMGGGTQIARVASDALLLSERLESLADAILLARRSRRIIKQNLVWALCYNAMALPAAALGVVAPWMAAIGMSASSLIVVGNSLTLLAAKRPTAERRPRADSARLAPGVESTTTA